MNGIENVCRTAKQSSCELAVLNNEYKNKMLSVIAGALTDNSGAILAANKKDIKKSTKPKHFIDRLTLNAARINQMADGIRTLIDLPDPVGEVLDCRTVQSGLEIKKVSVPLGVVGIIYEARPNVTADVIGLCVKSGNAVVLRGGSDAIESNKTIVKVIKSALEAEGLMSESIQIIEDTSREGAEYFMKLNKYLDVLIPRGGAALIQSVVNNATVPIIETGTGNCHIYIEKTADIETAKNILINAKTQRTSVCNSAESLLIDREIAHRLPEILTVLKEKGVEIRGDKETCGLFPDAVPATEEDYYTEFLDMIISCNVVDGYSEAVYRINNYGTHHSDAIITKNEEAAKFFTELVNSAAVYVNASTRFTDGFEFGFGAEMGISTQKLHARGPVGLRELTSYKYIVRGNGEVRK